MRREMARVRVDHLQRLFLRQQTVDLTVVLGKHETRGEMRERGAQRGVAELRVERYRHAAAPLRRERQQQCLLARLAHEQ